MPEFCRIDREGVGVSLSGCWEMELGSGCQYKVVVSWRVAVLCWWSRSRSHPRTYEQKQQKGNKRNITYKCFFDYDAIQTPYYRDNSCVGILVFAIYWRQLVLQAKWMRLAETYRPVEMGFFSRRIRKEIQFVFVRNKRFSSSCFVKVA